MMHMSTIVGKKTGTMQVISEKNQKPSILAFQ